RQRAAFEETIELVGRARAKGSRCERRSPAAGNRAELALGLRHDKIVAPALEVEARRLPSPARIGRGIELADQPYLLKRSLELRAQHAPLDTVEREQRRLDRGSLPLAPEVGPEARAQVARATDVEHLSTTVVKEVDAGPGRRAPRKSPLVVDAAPSRSGKRAQLGDTSGTPLLGKADEVQEHLSGCCGVWKRTVARGRRNAEEGGKRGKADAPEPAFEQAAGKRGRTEGRFGETTTMQHKELSLEKALVEPGVVSDE